MDRTERDERRIEQRLRYHWPIWFAEDFNETLVQGQIVDISSNGVAFTCHNDDTCPYDGQEVTARFSVPRFADDDAFDMANFTRQGRVCRIEDSSDFLRRVAIQFVDPLPFKPGEQADGNAETKQRLRAVTI